MSYFWWFGRHFCCSYYDFLHKFKHVCLGLLPCRDMKYTWSWRLSLRCAAFHLWRKRIFNSPPHNRNDATTATNWQNCSTSARGREDVFTLLKCPCKISTSAPPLRADIYFWEVLQNHPHMDLHLTLKILIYFLQGGVSHWQVWDGFEPLSVCLCLAIMTILAVMTKFGDYHRFWQLWQFSIILFQNTVVSHRALWQFSSLIQRDTKIETRNWKENMTILLIS